MKPVLTLFLIIVSGHLVAQEHWPELLERANSNDDYCIEFYDIMADHRMESSTAEGYFAISTMMLAKTGKNLFTKLSYFNKGKKILEATIESDPNNAELRFLRYTVQDQAPSILLYFNDMETDKEILDIYLANYSGELAARIQRYYEHN